VARTIGVSLSRLTAEQRERYLELAVFGEDVAIPGEVLARYWQATGGWSTFATGRVVTTVVRREALTVRVEVRVLRRSAVVAVG
jgi:hypothetical protein